MVHLRYLTVFILIGLLPFASIAQDEPFRIKTLVIDAGHGGKDPGNLGTGRYKTREKDIALDVAKRLGIYIKEQFPEIKVLYTRETDVFIGLNERADVANTAKADLFISVHCNAIGYASARGVETWVLGLHKNEENLQIAMKENSAIFLEDDYETKYEGFDPNSPESIIALTLMQSAFLEQSSKISSYIQRQFKERVGRRDRGVKQAGFLVLRKTTMPSILIELGFLTNPEEEDFLNTESGRVYMASAILRGFKEYKELVEDPLPETEKVETGGTEEKTEVSDELRQAELKAELERKKAELDRKKGVDEKARQDSLDRVAEVEAARINVELEAKKKAEEEAKKAEVARLAAEEARIAEEKAAADQATADAKAKAEADQKARQEALNRIETERLKREVMAAQREEEARIKAEAEKKAEEEQAAKDAQSAQLDEEAKRLAELKVKRAEIEARLAKLDEPKTEKKEQPKETTTKSTEATGILFKIQIHTATKLLARSYGLFQGLNPEQYEQDGLYKYTVGNFNTSDEAGEMQSEMRDRGFRGAFIVAFKNGERIKLSEARKLTENNGN